MKAMFADLDGTTIYSRRRLGEVTDVVPAEFDNGQPIAWMTATAARQLVALRSRVEFVPTTTRTKHQFDRVALPGGPTRYAIIANGGRILVDGVEDTGWTDRMLDTDLWDFAPVDDVAARLERLVAGEPWVRRVLGIDGFVTVVSGIGQTPPPAWFLAAAQEIADTSGYRLYPQGPKTFLIPAHVSKEHAASEIADRLAVAGGSDSPVTFAAGDHFIDAGVMLWADAAIQPAHGVNIPGVPVTQRSGVAAGEEILAAAAAVFEAADLGVHTWPGCRA